MGRHRRTRAVGPAASVYGCVVRSEECGTRIVCACRVSVRQLALHDRPREKLRRLGPAGLGDNELLAAVLGHGSQNESALDIANRVLFHAGGVHGLTRFLEGQLQGVAGVGPAMSARIMAAIELGRRTLALPDARTRLGGPRDVARYLLPRYGARSVEQFGVVQLDARQRVLLTALLSVGTLDETLAHPREVFRMATAGGAAAIVVFHNHPSGDPTPSEDDVALTARLVEAGAIMGIDVLDHMVLADACYYSFKEHGRL